HAAAGHVGEALVHTDRLAGLGVTLADPRWQRLVRVAAQAARLRRAAHAKHPTAATPAIGRVMRLPEGVVLGAHDAVQRHVVRARALHEVRVLVHPVGVAAVLQLGAAAGGVAGEQVGLVDDARAPGQATAALGPVGGAV